MLLLRLIWHFGRLDVLLSWLLARDSSRRGRKRHFASLFLLTLIIKLLLLLLRLLLLLLLLLQQPGLLVLVLEDLEGDRWWRLVELRWRNEG